ncbi:helix-turn-helix transcriptional regulator [Bacteroides heparinolyticus]|uniref:helix-turn-helix transcriptional regulator n=1 Tax=Prevotella heparinolytica TaxID=28113 RepID=UPI00359F93EB
MKKLVDFLRETRLKLGYKQDYIAEKVGVASSTISRWENGTTAPNLTQVEAYARALQLTSEDLFASLANEEGKPQPIAEFRIEVFTKDVDVAVMQAIAALSEKYLINSTHTRKWT